MTFLALIAIIFFGFAVYNLTCAFVDIPTKKTSQMMMLSRKQQGTKNEKLLDVYVTKIAGWIAPYLRLDRLIDIGQVFLDRTDQILGAQVGSRDDGNSGFQFFIQVLFIAGGSAAQIPDWYKGKTDTQNGHHVHIPNQKGKYSPHSEQDQRQSFYCLIAVRPSGALQDLFQFVILIKKALGWCAQKNIQFIRQGGGFSLGAEEGVNKITRLHTKQSQKPGTEQDKTDKIDPLQLTHLLWRLHEFFQFLVGNAIVQ